MLYSFNGDQRAYTFKIISFQKLWNYKSYTLNQKKN